MIRYLVPLLVLAAGPAPAQTADPHAAHMTGAATSGTPSERYRAIMNGMHSGPDAVIGDAGTDYARMMIVHHQSAVDMARVYLESGHGDPALTRLSEEVVRSQEAEIATLRNWLATHGG